MTKSIYPAPRHIIITGSSSGLGAALAQLYAQPGVVLGLLGRNGPRLEQIATLCREQGAEVQIGLIDISDEHAVTTWITTFDQQHPVELCFCKCGSSAGTGGGGETLEQVKKIFDVNVTGVLHTIHPVLDGMVKRGAGQIAIISSMAGWVGLPGAPAYGASKAAVRIYGQALRSFYGPKGIRVNVVCPGFIKTPMTDVNPFPMPFMLMPDQAAHTIRDELQRNKGLIAFPWQKFVVVRILSMLPDWVVTWFGRRLPDKPAKAD